MWQNSFLLSFSAQTIDRNVNPLEKKRKKKLYSLPTVNELYTRFNTRCRTHNPLRIGEGIWGKTSIAKCTYRISCTRSVLLYSTYVMGLLFFQPIFVGSLSLCPYLLLFPQMNKSMRIEGNGLCNIIKITMRHFSPIPQFKLHCKTQCSYCAGHRSITVTISWC